MSGCQCKSGFFALRDCQGPVVTQCPTCRRAICARHSTVAAGSTQCLDCWAKGQKQPPRDPGAVGADPELDQQWTYGYRHRYYSSGGYMPIYTGHRHGTYYDSYDTRSFAPGVAVGAAVGDDLEHDDRAGFGDS